MASDDSPYAPKPRPTKWLFFEDMVPGTVNTSSCAYTANKKEMMDFARKWDPLDPKHLGSEGGKIRLGLPFYEIEAKRAFRSVGLHKKFLRGRACAV